MVIRMKTIKQAVQSIITNHTPGHNALKALLYVLSFLYGLPVRFRLWLYRLGMYKTKKLPCAVVAVGNITVGGTGKTPTTVRIAKAIQQRGFRVAILSRGYGGTKEKTGAVVSDGRSTLLTATEAGDEPYLMARLLPQTPVIVGADRYTGGSLAINRFNPDVIVLDDAYQHIKLERDLNFLLLDASAPLGNGHLLPRGPLREPLSAVQRSDIIVYTRSGDRSSPPHPTSSINTGDRLAFHSRHRSVIRAIVPKGPWADGFPIAAVKDGQAMNDLSGKSFFVFSGLAGNQSFWQSLKKNSWRVSGTMGFEDHHRYSHQDLDTVNSKALASKAHYIVTTDKDAVRIPDHFPFEKDVVIVGVEIDFGSEEPQWEKLWDIWLKQHLIQDRNRMPRLAPDGQVNADP